MANAVVKFEKIYVNKSVKLLFGDRTTIKINGVLKQILSSSSDFSVSVNWGDGTTETITDIDLIHHTYGTKGSKTIIVTGGWVDSSGNRYLSFPKCSVTRMDNTYIRPVEKQTLTIKDGYLCIKFKGDYIGLSSENTIRVKKGQKNKFVNKTGESITVNGTTIANNATSALITMPPSGNPTITGTGFDTITLSLEDDYNADGTGLTTEGKFKGMLTANHRVGGYPYVRKKYTIGGIEPKLVPGNKLAKKITVNGYFKLHGTGDFAFFDKLQSLKYDRNVGGETNVGHPKQYQALEVTKFEYTFAGCINLRGDSNLMKKMWCKPFKMIGTFSGMSTELDIDAAKNWQKPPTFRGNFKQCVSIDYMAESSNFDVDVSSWNFSENKIQSAIGFAQNSNYRKDISSLSSKFTAGVVTTNIFEGADSIPEASKQALGGSESKKDYYTITGTSTATLVSGGTGHSFEIVSPDGDLNGWWTRVEYTWTGGYSMTPGETETGHMWINDPDPEEATLFIHQTMTDSPGIMNTGVGRTMWMVMDVADYSNSYTLSSFTTVQDLLDDFVSNFQDWIVGTPSASFSYPGWWEELVVSAGAGGDYYEGCNGDDASAVSESCTADTVTTTSSTGFTTWYDADGTEIWEAENASF